MGVLKAGIYQLVPVVSFHTVTCDSATLALSLLSYAQRVPISEPWHLPFASLNSLPLSLHMACLFPRSFIQWDHP